MLIIKAGFLLMVFFLIFTPNETLSAPAPEGIAINQSTRECVSYWPGDEDINYNLPDGWVAYFPNEYKEGGTSSAVWTTEYGTCKNYGGEFFRPSEMKRCFESAFGFTFINQTQYLYPNEFLAEEINKVVFCDDKDPNKIELGVLADIKNKTATIASCSYLYDILEGDKKYSGHTYINGTTKLTDNLMFYQSDYGQFQYKQDYGYGIVDTPYGSCKISRLDVAKCCRELGLSYLPGNISTCQSCKGLLSLSGLVVCYSLYALMIILLFFSYNHKKKTGSFIPFVNKFSRKGLFIGLIIGLLSFASSYSALSISGCAITYPFRYLFSILNYPLIKILALIYEIFGSSIEYVSYYFAVFTRIVPSSSLIFLLIKNFTYFGLIGWIIGLFIGKARRKNNISALDNYIRDARANGIDNSKIYQALLEAGWPEDDIKKTLDSF